MKKERKKENQRDEETKTNNLGYLKDIGTYIVAGSVELLPKKPPDSPVSVLCASEIRTP